MDTYVVHDHIGNIVSVSSVNTDDQLSAGRLPPEGHSIAKIELPTQIDLQDIASIEALVADYRVDIKSGRLIQLKK